MKPPSATGASSASARSPVSGRRSSRRAQAEAGIAARLEAARRHCEARGTVLTPLRRRVLELLLARGGAAKAYDLQSDLRGRDQSAAPMTVYRALEFLIENGLVHRVDALNSFMVCNHDPGDHPATLLICEICEETSELLDDAVPDAVKHHLRSIESGFRQTQIEIKGVCSNCGGKARAGRPAPARP